TPDGAGHDGPIESAPPPGSIVFVSSATGLDANDGTDPTKPKKSIAAALVKAQAIGAAAQVHVCAGIYQETALVLAQSIRLLGSYDCSSWTRTGGYGYPTFDAVNLTVVSNAAPATQPATLVVGAGVTSSGVVDGFLISGASSSVGATAALQIAGGASPVITNDVVTGGTGSGGTSNAGSIGIDVGGGSPRISLDSITGGSGTGSPGSVGVYVRPGATPTITGALVSGGTGTSVSPTNDQASVGILVTTSLTQSAQLKDLFVTGSDKNGVAGSSTGVFVIGSGLTVDVVGCDIQGGSGSGSATASAGVIVADPGGTVRVLSSHILGGARSGASSQAYGVYVLQASEVDVENDEIHPGEIGSASGSSTAAVAAASSGAMILVDDTLYSGPGPGYAISLASGVAGVTVTDDLLLGGGISSGQVAISMGACSGQLKTLDHTAFVNFDLLYQCTGQPAASDVPTMATELPGVSTAGDFNVSSAGTCTVATSCVPDPSCPAAPSTCLPSVLGTSWTSDDGVTGLFAGPPQVGDASAPFAGWVLPAGTPCPIARGGTPYGGITLDLFGQLRDTSKPTIGAFEFVSSACK
ncbi:MAG: hypothetical protein ACRELB_16490, partial [Polyangiaceae bacterium]